MPIYEYKCKCGTLFERILPFREMNIPQKCGCGEIAERVKYSESNFHLKGRWFKTEGEY